MNYHYKPTGKFFGVYNDSGVMLDAFLYEENARMATNFKNTGTMDDLQKHNITFAAKKALERLLTYPKLSEAADAALLLTKGSGMIEVKEEPNIAIYALIFNPQHTGRINRKSRPRFSPVFLKGQLPESPVIEQIRFFNAQFGT